MAIASGPNFLSININNPKAQTYVDQLTHSGSGFSSRAGVLLASFCPVPYLLHAFQMHFRCKIDFPVFFSTGWSR